MGFRDPILTVVAMGLAGAALVAGDVAMSQPKAVHTTHGDSPTSRNIYDFRVATIDGTPKSLADYRGRTLLIVNTASRCGFTPQYASLETLYQRYKDRGFEILAFPANNFMGQEPGTNAEIKEFCSVRYRTTFPLFEKISVKGKDIAPLYAYLTRESSHSGGILWNFTKFLVGPDGRVIARFGPATDPLDKSVTEGIESSLANRTPEPRPRPNNEEPLRTVSHVDLARYVGTWYEIASYPQRFQKGCTATTAVYTLREDGKIQVVNRCHRDSLQGRETTARGRARVIDRETNAKLKVTFFWPFWGDYWIIDLDPDYRYAVVGHPNRKYLWILSRTRAMDPLVYAGILERLTAQGYDISRLRVTLQPREPSGP